MELRTDISFEIKQKINEPEFIILKTIPEKDVEIWIDDNKKGVTPVKSIQLTPGMHSIKFSKALYHSLEQKIEVKTNAVYRFNFTLKPKFGKLYINSIGEFNGAKVFLDEEERCETPCKLEIVKTCLKNGDHLT